MCCVTRTKPWMLRPRSPDLGIPDEIEGQLAPWAAGLPVSGDDRWKWADDLLVAGPQSDKGRQWLKALVGGPPLKGYSPVWLDEVAPDAAVSA